MSPGPFTARRLTHRRALQNVFDVRVQPRDDVRRNDPPDAARGSGAGVDRGLDRAGVAADENRNEPAPDLLFRDEPDVRRFDRWA
jgi:hypothetical protein